MSNTITIELCAEDRARLDRLESTMARLATALEAKVAQDAPTFIKVSSDSLGQPATTMAKASTHAEAPQKPQDEPKAEVEENTQPTEEPTTAPEPTGEPAPETAEPTITLEQIHQKVLQLASGDNGAKKVAVRTLINTYANRVSDLPEDKWAEVWDKLVALESEG